MLLQTNKQTEKQTNKETERQTDRAKTICPNLLMSRYTKGHNCVKSIMRVSCPSDRVPFRQLSNSLHK